MKIAIAGPISVKSLYQHLTISNQYLELGSGGTAVNNIIHGMLKLGHQVSVYTLDSRIDDRLILRGPKLTIYFGKYRSSARSRALDLFSFEANQIRQFIQEDKPDIINAQWSYEYAMGAIKSGFPHLITFRDDAWEILKFFKDPYRAIRLLLDLRVKFKGKNFNVNSLYLQKQLNWFKKNLPIIPNPIDEAILVDQSRTLPEGKIKIVSLLNGWSKRKNPEAALKAFHLLYQKYKERVEYHLYGEGFSTNDPGYQWAKANNLTTNVHFHGEVDNKELMDSIENYDILFHSALEESFGNSLIEGLAKGLPVVGGKDSGAVPWVLNYGKNGVLVDVKSPQSTFEGLDRLIQDKSLYESLSAGGLTYIKENFTSQIIAQKYVGLYQKLLKQDQ